MHSGHCPGAGESRCRQGGVTRRRTATGQRIAQRAPVAVQIAKQVIDAEKVLLWPRRLKHWLALFPPH